GQEGTARGRPGGPAGTGAYASSLASYKPIGRDSTFRADDASLHCRGARAGGKPRGLGLTGAADFRIVPPPGGGPASTARRIGPGRRPPTGVTAMKRTVVPGLVLLLGCGCSTMSNTESGALGGGALGAGIGALFG